MQTGKGDRQDALAEIQRILREGQARKDLSQDRIVAKTGLGRTTVSNAFNGSTAPSHRTLRRLAEVLDIPFRELEELRLVAAAKDAPPDDAIPKFEDETPGAGEPEPTADASRRTLPGNGWLAALVATVTVVVLLWKYGIPFDSPAAREDPSAVAEDCRQPLLAGDLIPSEQNAVSEPSDSDLTIQAWVDDSPFRVTRETIDASSLPGAEFFELAGGKGLANVSSTGITLVMTNTSQDSVAITDLRPAVTQRLPAASGALIVAGGGNPEEGFFLDLDLDCADPRLVENGKEFLTDRPAFTLAPAEQSVLKIVPETTSSYVQFVFHLRYVRASDGSGHAVKISSSGPSMRDFAISPQLPTMQYRQLWMLGQGSFTLLSKEEQRKY